MENHQQEKKLKSLWHASNCMSCGKLFVIFFKYKYLNIVKGKFYKGIRKFIYIPYSSLNLYFKGQGYTTTFLFVYPKIDFPQKGIKFEV